MKCSNGKQLERDQNMPVSVRDREREGRRLTSFYPVGRELPSMQSQTDPVPAEIMFKHPDQHFDPEPW